MIGVLAVEKEKRFYAHWLFWKPNAVVRKEVGDRAYEVIILSEKRFQKNREKEIIRGLDWAKEVDCIYLDPFFREQQDFLMDCSAYKQLKTKNYFMDFFEKVTDKLPKFLSMPSREIALAIVDEKAEFINEKMLERIAMKFGETYLYVENNKVAERGAHRIYERTGAPIFVKELSQTRKITADAVIVLDASKETVIHAKLIFNPNECATKILSGRQIKNLHIVIPPQLEKALPENYSKNEKLTLLEALFVHEYIVNFELRC